MSVSRWAYTEECDQLVCLGDCDLCIYPKIPGLKATQMECIELDELTNEPTPGKWIPIEKGDRGYSAGDFRCSVCGLPNRCYSITDFCCNCGADMRGGKHENA